MTRQKCRVVKLIQEPNVYIASKIGTQIPEIIARAIDDAFVIFPGLDIDDAIRAVVDSFAHQRNLDFMREQVVRHSVMADVLGYEGKRHG